jgi:hypothetical protein
MKIHLRGAIAIVAMIATPTFAETTAPQVVTPNTTPNTQSSGAGVQGKPGGKSGPAVRRDGTAAMDQGTANTRLQDTSGVQGKPGGKSGPAVVPPTSATSR